MAREGAAIRIGAFVAGGVAILAAALLAFGAGDLFRNSVQRVVIFGESLQGLQIGAPVTYNGVPVGSVARIGGAVDAEAGEIVTGVALDIQGGVLVSDEPGLDIDEILGLLVERGLRAQLATQSLVTGALYVQLVFAPDAEPYRAPRVFLGAETLPAIPSDRERLFSFAQNLGEDLPLALERLSTAADRIALLFDDANRDRIARTLDGLATFSESLAEAGPRFNAALAEGEDALAQMAAIAETVDRVAAGVEGFIEDNRAAATAAVARTAEGADALAAMAEQMRALAAENRAAIREFTNEGLPAYRTLAIEGASMARTVEALARRLEEEGAGFLLGGPPVREYQPQTRPR
jgi:paraquat-inducible protein B